MISIIARGIRRRAGLSATLATWGIIVSIIAIVFWVTITIIGIVLGSNMITVCLELGPGVHVQDGVEFTCS